MKKEVGALILRLTVGVIFFFHGLAKFQGGIENTVNMFADLGLPGVLAYVVAFVELIGGVALILGLGTRVVSLLLAVIMVVAILKVKLTNGLLGTGQAAGFELDLTLLAMSTYLIINGNTLFSVDQILSKKSNDQKAVA
ncbi:DoxX family protein [Halobacillus shinanisalinarum]|uniref:DoxX family protein n=1 Tax=Halobacillus shinanisalinarum TaxID=2932258 RepID=A0ABY4GUL4_9BACI|nr:DoxX family protein [Halobacillus shinanisalinarum]UOQ91593.1 DoxX family protein [Halobacillus shinanisalinarum]